MSPLLPNLGNIGPGQTPAAAPAPAPRAGLPDKGALEYVKLTVELLLLLLAVPWIIRELIRNPGRASRRAAAKQALG